MALIAATPTSLAAGNRLTELLLGIAANLCCHTQLAPALAADAVFVEAVVATLLSCTYAPALNETCRALEAALTSGCSGAWAAALLTPAALERLVWVAENTRLHDLRNRCALRFCDTPALEVLGSACAGSCTTHISRLLLRIWSRPAQRCLQERARPAAAPQEPGHFSSAGRLGNSPWRCLKQQRRSASDARRRSAARGRAAGERAGAAPGRRDGRGVGGGRRRWGGVTELPAGLACSAAGTHLHL